MCAFTVLMKEGKTVLTELLSLKTVSITPRRTDTLSRETTVKIAFDLF